MVLFTAGICWVMGGGLGGNQCGLYGATRHTILEAQGPAGGRADRAGAGRSKRQKDCHASYLILQPRPSSCSYRAMSDQS